MLELGRFAGDHRVSWCGRPLAAFLKSFGFQPDDSGGYLKPPPSKGFFIFMCAFADTFVTLVRSLTAQLHGASAVLPTAVAKIKTASEHEATSDVKGVLLAVLPDSVALRACPALPPPGWNPRTKAKDALHELCAKAAASSVLATRSGSDVLNILGFKCPPLQTPASLARQRLETAAHL
jgi:hypothetical protein